MPSTPQKNSLFYVASDWPDTSDPELPELPPGWFMDITREDFRRILDVCMTGNLRTLTDEQLYKLYVLLKTSHASLRSLLSESIDRHTLWEIEDRLLRALDVHRGRARAPTPFAPSSPTLAPNQNYTWSPAKPNPDEEDWGQQ